MASLKVQQDPLQSAERTRFNADPFAHLQERPRLVRDARRDHGLDCTDFGLIHGNGGPVHTYDLNDTRSFQNWEPVLWVESTEQVTRKQWSLYFFNSIRPSPSALVERKKPLVTLPMQIIGNARFAARAHLQS